MKPWQKVLLLSSYKYLRKTLDPEALMDDLIVSDVINIEDRETLTRLNRHERVGWIIWHLLQKKNTEQSYLAFLDILKQKEPTIYHDLTKQEHKLQNGKLSF